MGLDTECDLAIVSSGRDERAGVIQSFRHSLLGEHLGVEPEVVAATEQQCGSLIGAIDSMAGDERTLCQLEVDIPDNVDRLVPDAALIDPEKPVDPDKLLGYLVGGKRRWFSAPLVRLILLVAVVLAMAAAWRWTPLAEWLDADRLTVAVEWMQQSRFTPLLVIGGFVLGGFLVIPVTLMIVATVMVLGPWTGMIYALAGAELSALLTFAAGHWLGRDAVSRLAGSQINSVARALSKRGLLTVITLRIVPVAPFTVINVIAGVSEIRFRDFALGSLIGLLPGVVGVAFLADRIVASLQTPSATSLLWLAVAVVAVAMLLLGLRRLLARVRSRNSD
jgi:uncharacterized membrane protein YdjX (TVP38/TMEM64 family)